MADEILANRAAFIGEQTVRNVWHMKGWYTGIDAKGQPIPFKDIDEAAAKGRILYDVFKRPIYLDEGVEVPNMYLLARDRDVDDPVPEEFEGMSLDEIKEVAGPIILSPQTVTDRYNVYQTQLAIESLRPLVEAGLLKLTGVGVLRNGAKVFISAEITVATVRTNPDGTPDDIKRHVMFMVGHDGRTANEMNVSDIRVVCANTARLAVARGVTLYLRHNRQDGEEAYKGAQENLAKLSVDFKAVIDEFRFLASVKTKSAEIDTFFNAFIAGEEGKDLGVRVAAQMRTIKALFNGEGTGLGGGTWWDLYNAVTEQLDWHSVKDPNTADHLDSILFGGRAKRREDAYDIILDMAKAGSTPTPHKLGVVAA